MPFEVFISYSHRDREFRDELDKHLANLRRQQVISSWYDGDIAPGSEWQPQIMENLTTAQIILLLISADFMASDFCYSTEMTQAIARHDADQARVIPIILRPVDWKGTPFAKLKVLPTDGKAVTRWPTPFRGRFFMLPPWEGQEKRLVSLCSLSCPCLCSFSFASWVGPACAAVGCWATALG